MQDAFNLKMLLNVMSLKFDVFAFKPGLLEWFKYSSDNKHQMGKNASIKCNFPL